jgi:hypothetical protein
MGVLLNEMHAIDIETVSQGAVADRYTEHIEVKLGNIKDPEKIKDKMNEAKAKARNSHGLSWVTGKVWCVSVTNINSGESASFLDYTEEAVLNVLSGHLNKVNSGMAMLWAKSGKHFDYPFLIGRYLANNLPVPAILRDSKKLKDIDDLLSFSQSCTQRDKLSAYAHALGIEGKSLSGGMVQGLYNKSLVSTSEDRDKIIKEVTMYCEGDTRIVAEFVRRYYGKDH